MWTIEAGTQRRVGIGLLYLAGTGVAYALCILFLAAGGDRPGDFAPWLRISPDTYFWWEAAFIAPVIVGSGLLAAAYALCVLFLAAGGDRPGDFAPWLRISTDTYFWWEAAFIAPVIVGSGLLAAACMYLLARPARGTGSFDDTLAILGPAVAVCTAVTLVPDLIIGGLLNTGVLEPDAWMRDITRPSVTLALVWAYLLAYIVAFLVAFPVAARTAHRLPWRSAVPIGWASFAIYQGVLLVFVR